MHLVPEAERLLSNLPERLATDLFARGSRVRLAADQVLFLVGDPGDSCFRVEDGLLKVVMVSNSGVERILALVGKGQIVGEFAIIDGLPRSASVGAVRETVLRRLSRAQFYAFAESHTELYRLLNEMLTRRLRQTDMKVAAESFLSMSGRVARALLEFAEHFGRDINPDRVVIEYKIGQSDLAAMAGIARENVNRILRDWERRKMVSRKSGFYCLEGASKFHEMREI
jgi:CRP-like cAMP-binding protein